MQATDFKEKRQSGDIQSSKVERRAVVDSERRIIFPPEMASRYGFRPGAEVFIDEVMNGLRLRMPVTHLAKVYVEPTNRCPFIESGAAAISWEGNVSPCLPLLHSNMNFLDGRERFSRKYVVGNIKDGDLQTLWNKPEYVALRERVKIFDCSPCYICGGCDLAEANEEDCFGNSFPTCGGCLWAQGIIRCP
jgi:hypothetical protein